MAAACRNVYPGYQRRYPMFLPQRGTPVRVVIPATELLEHHRSRANFAYCCCRRRFSFLWQLRHHTGNESSLFACPLLNGVDSRDLRRGSAIDDQHLWIGVLTSCHSRILMPLGLSIGRRPVLEEHAKSRRSSPCLDFRSNSTFDAGFC